MVMKVFKKKPKNVNIKRTESLDCKPVKNVHVTETLLENGEVLLTYPVMTRPWFANLIRHLGGPSEKAHTKKLQLDILGTAVWELMDGKLTVRQVIQRFAMKHQLHSREAEVSITLFLRDLGKRGIIGLR